MERSFQSERSSHRTDVGGHRNPSGSELHRTLPTVDVLTEYNVHFKGIKALHIDKALKELQEGLANAKRNMRNTSLTQFILKHSKTMAMYANALKEMQDFKSLWDQGKRELALDKWKQWEQRSQANLPDADIATLATNAIGQAILYERLGSGPKIEKRGDNISQELAHREIDMSKIHPSEYLLACHDNRERQHWERILQLHYNGVFEGFQGEEAINRFYGRLDIHTQSLIENGKIFRVVRPRDLYFLLTNRNEKLPTTLGNDIENISKNQAMYSSSEAPIHTYMFDSDNAVVPQGKKISLDMFGSIIIRFKKDHIINRATLTFDDTGIHYWRKENEITIVPRPVTQVDRKVWPLVARSIRPRDLYQAERFQNQNPLAVRSIGDLDNFVEVQVRGDLKIDDIEKVFLPQEIPSFYQRDEEILRAFPKLLDECNIEREYR